MRKLPTARGENHPASGGSATHQIVESIPGVAKSLLQFAINRRSVGAHEIDEIITFCISPRIVVYMYVYGGLSSEVHFHLQSHHKLFHGCNSCPNWYFNYYTSMMDDSQAAHGMQSCTAAHASRTAVLTLTSPPRIELGRYIMTHDSQIYLYHQVVDMRDLRWRTNTSKTSLTNENAAKGPT